MNPAAFHATRPEDLGLPLMTAYAQAEQDGVSVFRIELDPIDYGRDPVQLQPLDLPPKMAVEMVAARGPATLHAAISIDASSIRLAGVVLDAPEFPASAIILRAVDRIEVDGVAVIGARSSDVRSDDPLVQWVALGPATSVVARRLWLVDNALAGRGPILVTQNVGRGRFGTAEIEKSVFAGNSASIGIRTYSAKAITLRSFAALEPGLRTTWLDIGSPETRISLAEGVVATPKLAGFDLEPGEKLSAFPAIEAKAIEFRGPTKKDHVHADGGSFGPLAKTPADWKFAADPARRLGEPDVAALAAALE